MRDCAGPAARIWTNLALARPSKITNAQVAVRSSDCPWPRSGYRARPVTAVIFALGRYGLWPYIRRVTQPGVPHSGYPLDLRDVRRVRSTHSGPVGDLQSAPGSTRSWSRPGSKMYAASSLPRRPSSGMSSSA